MVDRLELPSAWGAVLATLGQGPDLAWEPSELARLVQDRAARQRLFAAALQVRLAESMGHTRLDVTGERVPQWLASFGPLLEGDQLLKESALQGFVADPSGLAPIVAGPGWLATGRAWTHEQALAAQILHRLDSAPPLIIPDGALDSPMVLNAEQRAAVQLAAGSKLAIITGGPGTGKSAIVAALLKGTQGLKVAVAAPTGKAAQRLGESLRGIATPSTLHRLLGWRPGPAQWRHHAANPLEADLVVVDEASMVDQELMLHLLNALHPEARLILLGDADQLPSVGSGAVLRDLVERLPSITAKLHHSYRMDAADPGGQAILAYAARMREGRSEVRDLSPGTSEEVLHGQGVAIVPRTELGTLLVQWRERIMALPDYEALIHREYHATVDGFDEEDAAAIRHLLEHHERFRLLALLQEGPEGVDALNEALHRLAWSLNGRGLQRELPFYLGEPVMMKRNDQGRDLFNGETGLALKVRREKTLHREAVFPGVNGPRAFPVATLGSDLTLAYALTVHKSQGSEFDTVGVVLPRTDHPLLTRQNLYTALTRARRSVFFVGDPSLPVLASQREERRSTGLGELLSC